MSDIMNEDFYKRIINESTGYGLHKIVLDSKGIPVDYIFIDVNETFEKYTGLKSKDVLNKRVIEVLPGIVGGEFDWISFYGEIALGGEAREIEQYSEPLNKHYHIKVFSPEKDYFVTLFSDVSVEMEISNMSKWMMEHEGDDIDYKMITDKMLLISEAKYAVFNLFDKNEREFTTVAASGIHDHIARAGELLGFNIIGRKWDYDGSRDEKLKGRSLTCFDDVHSLAGDVISRRVVNIIEKTFNLGQTVVVKIMSNSRVLGDFTMIMPKGKLLNRIGLIELYASQIGLFLEKKKAEHKLILSHNRMELAMNASENGFWDWNISTGEVYLNSVFWRMLGYEEGELEFNIDALIDLMHPDDKSDVMPRIMEHIENRQPYEEEFRFLCKNGDWKWISGRGKSYDTDDDGKPNRVVGMNVDITRIKEANQKFDRIFRGNPALMAVSSLPEKVVTEVNDAFVDATGYSRHEIIGRSYMELDLFPVADQQEEMLRVLDEEVKINESNLKLRTRDGRILDGLLYGEIIESQGKKFYLTMMIDITDLRKSQDRIEHMSHHDQLTGLYNRRFYETELKRLDTARNFPLSIIMIDVNGLKLVNDAFGHDKGDELLVKVANAIMRECRSDDIIARLGGDEFVVLLPKTSREDALVIAERISLGASTEKVGLINISVSCGVGTKECEETVAKTFKKAEEEMYKNKLFESQNMRKSTIEKIMETLYKMNLIEEEHSRNVAGLSGKIAEAFGLKPEKTIEIYKTGLRHDIGKIAIDPELLDKKGQLTDVEWSEVKRHSEAGYQILRSVNDYAFMANYVLAHHERCDGSGYPGGLKGEEIPIESRIIAIADAYDAMTNDRPYRKALGIDTAVRELLNGSGTQFDPELVDVFIEKVLKYKYE
jgi:diguanylate cyclase (GGDEF)-like protein/PAS domain S-box-containing protein